MQRKNYQFMHMPDDRVLLGIAAGFLSGLFSGAFAGVALTLLINNAPEGTFGVGAYVLESHPRYRPMPAGLRPYGSIRDDLQSTTTDPKLTPFCT